MHFESSSINSRIVLVQASVYRWNDNHSVELQSIYSTVRGAEWGNGLRRPERRDYTPTRDEMLTAIFRE
jgi:hypothetical protein